MIPAVMVIVEADQAMVIPVTVTMSGTSIQETVDLVVEETQEMIMMIGRTVAAIGKTGI